MGGKEQGLQGSPHCYNFMLPCLASSTILWWADKESLINSKHNTLYVNNILAIVWIIENVLNRCIIHSTVAVLTSCDQMTSTGNEAWCVPKPASRGNSCANLAGLDFSPKSSELTLQWKLLQSEKKSLISGAHFPIFIRLFLFLLEV